MKNSFCFLLVLFFQSFFSQSFFSQDISKKLDQATKSLLNESEMYSANLSFYVADEQGNFIYEYQGNKGLSTASTQKVFTAMAALEMLGKDFRYTTKVSYTGNIEEGRLSGDLIVSSNGDPTLGSWRYTGYKPEDFQNKVIQAIKSLGIYKIGGNLIIDDSYFDIQTIPGGWPWNDIGNYYGAGVWGVNWRENQFDMHISGGANAGTSTSFKKMVNLPEQVKWVNETQSAGKETGDRSIIYTAPYSEVAYINGTLPSGKTIVVSGSVPNPPMQLGLEMYNWLSNNDIELKGKVISASQLLIEGKEYPSLKGKEILVHYSPTMDKIIYWFMRKSVNLYGETLVKTFGKVKNNNSSFLNSVKILKDFWKSKGIQAPMINFADGSGLSPQNYASARAEVQALIWGKKQSWFPIFEESIPLYNGMKMKSGTIKDAKAYAGYHTSKEGKKYVFAVIVNNYHGSNVNAKLFKLLDILK